MSQRADRKMTKSITTHNKGVQRLAGKLELAGLKRLPDGNADWAALEPNSFVVSHRRPLRPQFGFMPRDIVMRVGDQLVDVKLYAVADDAVYSSLFRACAYTMFHRFIGDGVDAARGPHAEYLQLTSCELPPVMEWFAGRLGDFDPAKPWGLHNEAVALKRLAEHLARPIDQTIH